MGCESSTLLYADTKAIQLNANIDYISSNSVYNTEPTVAPLQQTNSNNSFRDKIINKLNNRTNQMQFVFNKISKYNKQIETEYSNILSAIEELTSSQIQINREYVINNHSKITNYNFDYNVINSCSDSEEPQIIFDSSQKTINSIDI